MGQIKNIKLHIVTDIKYPITITMTVAPVAVNNVIRGARWIALISGIGYGASNSGPMSEQAKVRYQAKLKAAEAEAVAVAEKKAAEALSPGILQLVSGGGMTWRCLCKYSNICT